MSIREEWEELKAIWAVWTKDMGPSQWATVAGFVFMCIFWGLSAVVEGAWAVGDVGFLIALFTTLFRKYSTGRWWT